MCGIVGVYGVEDASLVVAQGLHRLQHRGQKAAGAVSTDGVRFFSRRNLGLVKDVLKAEDIRALKGSAAIGHVRYITAGEASLGETQPIIGYTKFGELAIAHNGNIPLYKEERERLMAKGELFTTTSDTELALHRIANVASATFRDAIHDAFSGFNGAYSMVILTPDVLVGMRDPWGFRPLYFGKLGVGWMFASEPHALTHVGATVIRSLEPGEIIMINAHGYVSNQCQKKEIESFCIFEKVYFGRPDVEDYVQIRENLGKELFKECPVQGGDDAMVVPVLASGQPAAQGYAKASGIDYKEALIRNHYNCRTFIAEKHSIKEGVHEKHSPSPHLIRGKRVVLVDDSIVRGSTMTEIVELVRGAGAKEVHVRLSCPPIISPCFFGINMQTKEELCAASRTIEEVGKYIGADTIGYLSLESMLRVCQDPKGERHCTSCYTGKYVMPVPKF